MGSGRIQQLRGGDRCGRHVAHLGAAGDAEIRFDNDPINLLARHPQPTQFKESLENRRAPELVRVIGLAADRLVVRVIMAMVIGVIGLVQKAARPGIRAMAIPRESPFRMKVGAVRRCVAVGCAPVIAKPLADGAGIAAAPGGQNIVVDRMSVFMEDHIGILIIIHAAMTERKPFQGRAVIGIVIAVVAVGIGLNGEIRNCTGIGVAQRLQITLILVNVEITHNVIECVVATGLRPLPARAGAGRGVGRLEILDLNPGAGERVDAGVIGNIAQNSRHIGI